MAQLISIAYLLTVLAFASAKSIQSDHGYGILGGELANITEFPHQVYFKRAGWDIWCGGSIISSKHILTRGACVFAPEEAYVVVAATADRQNGGEEYTLAQITQHPDAGSDIAVVRLAKEIKFSDKARPIALAGPNYRIKDGAQLIASGWGETEDGLTSDHLRKVTLTKVGDDECNNIRISSEFCAGAEGKGACLSDRGGPLIEKTKKRTVLVGVTQLTYGSCLGGEMHKPSGFVKVSLFNKWIKNIVEDDLQSSE